MKPCSTCNKIKAANDFAKCVRHADGRQYTCRTCTAAYRASRRDELKERDAARYRANSVSIKRRRAKYRREHMKQIRAYNETYHGSCLNTYRSLRARCTGRGPARSFHIYTGLPFCSKEQFLEWALLPENEAEWTAIKTRFRRTGKFRDRPSIDRLSAHVNVGYVPGNMRWTAYGDNAAKATLQRYHGRSAVSPYYTRENQIES